MPYLEVWRMNEDSNESVDSSGPLASAALKTINFANKTNTSESNVNSLRNRGYDSIASSLQSLFSSTNNRYSSEQPVPQNMSSLLSFAALGNHLKGFTDRKQSNSHTNNSWKKSSSTANLGPAPWIDKSFFTTPSTSSSHSGTLPSKVDALGKSTGPVDYTRYVKRFVNASDCGFPYCKELNYREHFHCMDCNSRVFVKKEEMIRHFKWHKKRDESLIHGFMRYSPCDDCSDKFPNCAHNRKQTHYHCLKQGCDKLVSDCANKHTTSDVQMHANYHRKDTAIIQEGFQRFRATEDCLLESCVFFGQRTTHFHCRRDNCNHTFKNKADMEKHKSYHIKDEQLNRDGFKKFMKHEICSFESCRFSRVCNHIHCIRPGCSYVLHSSGQLYSHKRKHERRENELAYRKFRLAQNMFRSLNNDNNTNIAFGFLEAKNIPGSNFGCDDDSNRSSNAMNEAEALASQLPLTQIGAIPLEDIIGEIPETKCLQLFTKFKKGEQCLTEDCKLKGNEHNHCKRCEFCASNLNQLLEHAKTHITQDEATPLIFEESDDGTVCTKECEYYQKERHYHCRMYGCSCVVPISDTSFKKLDHYLMHEQQQRINAQNELQSAAYSQSPPPPPQSQHFLDHQLMQPFTQTYPTGTSITSIDGLPILKRKRGRPPKNKIVEMPQTLYPNFKLPKNDLSSPLSMPLGISPFNLAAALYGNTNLSLPASTALSDMIACQSTGDDTKTIPIPLMLPYTKSNIQEGFIVFDEGFPCTDNLCKYFCQKHYHCSKPRCYYVTNISEAIVTHSKEFHDSIDIMEGFAYFDGGVDCRIAGCVHNKMNRHYHCTRNGCNYAFVRYTQMSPHEEKHKRENSVEKTNQICDQTYFANKSKSSATASQASSHSDDDRDSMKSPLNLNNNHMSNNCNNKMQTTVKAKGTFYPLSSLSKRKLSQSLTSNTKTDDESDEEDIDDCDSDVPNSEIMRREALNHLLQDQSPFNLNTQTNRLHRKLFSPTDEKHQQFSPSNGCGLPFCKLKKRDHFHCNVCNQL
ncbi:unnamed protein product [Medioppia subpectinata]|uniref:C2H2-type domain-containing protein n=1 Tax=Medioppia subpectinata TaxID=1979941 RepID=A0A7R9KDN1_9ACAR|nr:unnamed protein product [Medioppia subpectinata]CAG2101588.1 unnamed protein product [Medioppia subpectinata]